jgi:hypothetical protein
MPSRTVTTILADLIKPTEFSYTSRITVMEFLRAWNNLCGRNNAPTRRAMHYWYRHFEAADEEHRSIITTDLEYVEDPYLKCYDSECNITAYGRRMKHDCLAAQHGKG